MPLWSSKPPDLKVEVDSTEISHDSISVLVTRIENAIAQAKLFANDYKGKNFIGNLDVFLNLKISFRYGSDDWTKVFDGIIEDIEPQMNAQQGFLAAATAYGQGRALRNTHCATSYGEESENPTVKTPKQIWDDIVDNRINKNFDGGNTGYTIAKTYIGSIANPTIKYLHGGYRPNIQLINEICQVHTAYRAGNASVHWFVDVDGNLLIDTIGAHEHSAQWPNYLGGSQSASTLEQGRDQGSYSFSKRVRSKEYANKIILVTDLRKPGYDYWAEKAAANNLWLNEQNMTFADDTTYKQVGANSLKFTCSASNIGKARFPAANANWDFTKVGTQNNPPKLKFWARRTNNINHFINILLCTTDNTNYFYRQLFNTASDTALMPVAGQWYQIEFPLMGEKWDSSGSPSWSNIDFIEVYFANVGYAGSNDFWLDDIHFAGKIIREAYDSTAIASSKHEHQLIRCMNNSVDDSMIATDDTGMAARLAHAELLTRRQIPTVGVVITPGIVDVLPGQLTHIHADKMSDGNFRIDKDFRIKEIRSSFSPSGFSTSLDLTDDLVNTFAKSPHELSSVLAQVLFIDPEAQSLKATGLDPLVPRLSHDYPS